MKQPTSTVKKKNIFTRIGKILAWILASILLLFILIWILIQIPAVQNFIVGKVTNYVEGKIGTTVRIGHINISFPKKIVLENVYLEDQSQDTLLYGNELKVDISLFKLLKNTVEINEVDLDGITSHLFRDSTGRFNFDYIIDAFASQDTTTTADSPGMKFSINDIILDKINIKYHDDYMGYDVGFFLHHFDTDIKTFDLDKSSFKIGDINLDGLTTAIRQYKPLADKIEPADSTPSRPQQLLPEIIFIGVNLSRISFDYQNEIDSVFSNVQLGSLKVDPEKIDLNKQFIKLDELNLENTTAIIRLGKDPGAKEVAEKVNQATDTIVQTAKEQGWKFAVDKVNLRGNRFKYDDDNSPPIRSGMDYSHMDIQNLALETQDLYYSDSISGKINKLTFRDKSGANVKKLTTEFLFTDHQAYLKDLDLVTDDTHIQRDIAISYPSLKALADDIGSMQIDTELRNTVISVKDILYFAPMLSDISFFAKNRNAKLHADIVLKGSVDNLQIQKLVLTGFRNTKVNVDGYIKGLPDADKFSANLNIRNLSSTKADLASLLPPNTLPDNIDLPAQFAISGNFTGSLNKANTNLKLSSSYGKATIKAITENIADSIRARYNADVSLASFDVGKLIKQDTTIGQVTMQAHVAGTGYALTKMNADMNAVVQSAEYNGYTYHDLAMKGKANNGIIDVDADMDDPNIDFDLVAQMDLRKSKPAVKAELMVDSVNLKALHFYDDEFMIHTKLSADFAEIDADRPIGNLVLTGTLVKTATKRYTVDTTRVIASRTDSVYSVSMTSPVADLRIDGNYTLTGIGTAVTQIIDRYYAIGAPATAIPPQQANIRGVIYKSNLLEELVPDLKLSNNIYIRGDINSSSNLLALSAIAPRLTYKDQQIDSASVNIQTHDNRLDYAVAVNNYSTASMKVPLAKVSGTMANNELTYQLQVKDQKKKDKYYVAGMVKQMDGLYTLQLYNDSLRLNYEKWNIDPQNRITFGNAGLNASNFVLSHNEQSIAINSASPAMDAPVNVDLNNFKIETIASIINSDSLFMGGLINGNARITEVTKDPLFDANLTVKDFNYKKDTLGDIVIKADNLTPESYAAHVTISGKGNDVDINGKYITTGDGGLDFDVAIKSLNLSTVESLTGGQLRNMSGDIHGNLHINGAPSKPTIVGDLNMAQTSLVVSQLNAKFQIEQDKIQFREDGIYLDNFTIKDSVGNKAVIDGHVYTNDYSDFRYDLAVNADNFQLMNSKQKDNPVYFGRLFIDLDATIGGNMDLPIVNGDLTVNENTDITFVVPQTDPEVTRRENIVEFFDQDHPELDSILLQDADTLNQTKFKGFELAANVTIDPKATFNIIVDEANGDFLKLKGDGNLSAQIDQSGEITLTGTYELKEGSYEMSINFLRRKFDIKEGSSLTWSGGPTDANVNITAVYKTTAAPIDLVERQLTSMPDDVRNTYRQKIPFEVNLIMKEELLRPQLSFDIVLPEGNYNVAPEIIDATTTKLSQLRTQPSELNKQVFSLLLLNRFMADNPFQSGSSTSVSTMARQSVSKLLTEQLNKFAADVINGIDVNIGIESMDDYTTGRRQTRTDVNVGLSKRLFNDRIKVSVGSNFEVEGPVQQNEKSTNIAGDIQVDYQLTPDGHYILRGYRKDQYEMAVQGQVVETGLKFIISIDYDYWQEIVDRAKERRKQKKLDKEKKSTD